MSTSTILGQVNTETLRKSDLEKGFHNNIQFRLGLNAGNSEYLKLKSKFRLDYVADNYYTFGVIEYQRGLQADELFINKGFAHFRYINTFLKSIRWEIFTQKEFNDFIRLRDRNLAGMGLRKSFMFMQKKHSHINLHLGVGFMWENEELDLDPVTETNIIRSTNYVSANWKIDDRLQLIHINYFQFDVENPSDFRLLAESTLHFSITKAFHFQTSLEFRYDSEPPLFIKKYDLELTNGVTFAF
jgi:putative salt-induced outer membrane protein YdiY